MSAAPHLDTLHAIFSPKRDEEGPEGKLRRLCQGAEQVVPSFSRLVSSSLPGENTFKVERRVAVAITYETCSTAFPWQLHDASEASTSLQGPEKRSEVAAVVHGLFRDRRPASCSAVKAAADDETGYLAFEKSGEI